MALAIANRPEKKVPAARGGLWLLEVAQLTALRGGPDRLELPTSVLWGGSEYCDCPHRCTGRAQSTVIAHSGALGGGQSTVIAHIGALGGLRVL